MPFSRKTRFIVNKALANAGGGSSGGTSTANLRLLGQIASQAGADFGYSASDMAYYVWSCTTADKLALTNATISSGGVKNTITPATLGVDIMPTMGAASQSGYTISASGYTDANYPWYVCNGEAASGWWYLQNMAGGWIQFNLPSAIAVAGYTITVRPDGYYSYSPTSWYFQAYNGTDWVNLDYRAVSWSSAGQKQTFTIASPAAYQYYRLYIATSPGLGDTIAEMELLGVGTPATPNAASIVGTSYAVSDKTKGRLLTRITNLDATSAPDVSPTGKIKLYTSIDGNVSFGSPVAIEGSKQVTGGTYDVWTPELDFTNCASIGFALGSAGCNMSLDHAIILATA